MQNQCVDVRCCLDLELACSDHRNDSFVSEPCGHEEIVSVVVAVVDVKNDFVYHSTENDCNNIDEGRAEIYHRA